MWPNAGTSRDYLWNATGIFLGANLGLKGKLDKSNIESISRVAVPSGPGLNLKVQVLFVDNQSRDLVLGSAAMLASVIDEDGKPRARLRIEVPAHLQLEFQLLFKYGQSLRTWHGPGTTC